MISKISISWNENYQHDGLLYFVQRIVEMLDFMTIDIYRAPLLNTTRLIDEYLEICQGEAKAYHLEEVYNEFMHSFKNDIVLQYKLGDIRIQQIVNRLNKLPDKRQETMEFLHCSIGKDYLTWSKEYIKHIVPQNSQKRKIEKAIRCFVPELLRCGYSRDEIYHSTKQLLTDKIEPSSALTNFLEQYTQQVNTYCVYLVISDRLSAFKEILENRLKICFEDDGNFHKVGANNEFCVVKFTDIKALDASAAANRSFEKIELFATFYQYFGNYGDDLILNKALTISSDGVERKLVVNSRKYKSVESDNSPIVGKMSETIITNLFRSARGVVPKLKKITRLHNRAIANNGLENGFLNLWSIMEVICVSNPENSKIEQVKTIAVPILKRDYLPALFFDITENIKTILEPKEYKALLDSIADGTKEYEKIASLILLPEHSRKLDEFVDCLINYPVLRTRILNLHDDCQTRNELDNLTKRYAQRISWHLYRIYRARNTIIHSGKKPNDLKDLGEHLHAYVDSIMNEVIMKLGTSSLCQISNILVDSELQQEINDGYFREKVPINFDGIKLIFSQMNSWVD